MSERTVETHARQIFIKLGLYGEGCNKRVMAVLAYLDAAELDRQVR